MSGDARLDEVVRQIRAAGNNINQVAHALNVTMKQSGNQWPTKEKYPKACQCLANDQEALFTFYLGMPRGTSAGELSPFTTHQPTLHGFTLIEGFFSIWQIQQAVHRSCRQPTKFLYCFIEEYNQRCGPFLLTKGTALKHISSVVD